MDADWTVRAATAADVPAIVSLSDTLFQEDSGQRDPLMNHDWAKLHGRRYFAGLLDDPAYIVLVAARAGAVVGYLAGSTAEPGDLRPVRTAELESMCVAPGERGRGVGEALARAFLEWSTGRGAVWVSVSAYAANAGALAFYRRLGFAEHTVTLGRRLS
jgi:ribosomal protein S18 acetylase RimI-like enzyme